jgi:hypothetical protein
MAFRCDYVEAPAGWSNLAVAVVARRYFATDCRVLAETLRLPHLTPDPGASRRSARDPAQRRPRRGAARRPPGADRQTDRPTDNARVPSAACPRNSQAAGCRVEARKLSGGLRSRVRMVVHHRGRILSGMRRKWRVLVRPRYPSVPAPYELRNSRRCSGRTRSTLPASPGEMWRASTLPAAAAANDASVSPANRASAVIRCRKLSRSRA